jgi:hypothetical protein
MGSRISMGSRVRISKAPSVAQSIDLFAKHHIVGVRRKKNGEIVSVKHATFGWISPGAYVQMQHVHDALPLIGKFVEGGYRMKEALMGATLSIPGASIGIGGILYGGILAEMAPWILASVSGFKEGADPVAVEAIKEVEKWAIITTAGLLAPFGEILAFVAYPQFQAAITKAEGVALGEIIGSPTTFPQGPPGGPFGPPPGK